MAKLFRQASEAGESGQGKAFVADEIMRAVSD
jgi:hypothetical protein